MTASVRREQMIEGALPDTSEEIVWIALDQLRLGMFVHPLSRASFLLSHARDLEAIRESGVGGMFVDLKRSTGAKPERGVARPLGYKPAAAVQRPAAPARAPATMRTAAERRAAQFDAAAQTLGRLRVPVRALLDDVRLGKAIGGGAVAGIVEEINASVANNAAAIISLARIRDSDSFTYAHSVAVCALMANLARGMDLDAGSLQELGIAGLLHDVGKMLIPKEILNKPGRLTDPEMEVMRGHVTRGHELLKKGGNLPQAALEVCLSHHEKLDGTGYPERLSGAQIGLAARMGAVCDVYDAVTSNRPYKEAWSPAECLASMFSWQGHFDEDILSLFIRSVGIYPVGSLVRMASGHLAVVVEQCEGDLTRPTVRIFHCIATDTRVAPRDLSLAEVQSDAIVSRERPRKWGLEDWENSWLRLLAA